MDTTIRAGKLPTLRLRYSVRDQSQISAGTPTVKTNTNDLQSSINYKLGPLFVNADYRTQTTNDKLTGTITDSSQLVGQASLNQKIGTKIDLGLRDDYNTDNSKTNNAETAKRYSNISELRIIYNPFTGLNLNSTYSYRTTEDVFAGTGKTIETNWYSSFNYAFPKYLRFYGSYLTLNTDSPTTKTLNNNTIAGLNFSNTFGKYAFTLRYERRMNSITTEQAGTPTTKNDVSTNNLDWVLTSRLKPYLLITLSESYVGTTTTITPATTGSNGDTSNNQFRLKVGMGPVKNLSLNPYFDYTIATAMDGIQTVTKELVVPADFRVLLHQKLEFSISENYRWSSSQHPDSCKYLAKQQRNSQAHAFEAVPRDGHWRGRLF